MRIPDPSWLGRLDKATRLEGPTGAEGTHHPDLVKAGDDVYSKATALAQQVGGAPLDVAERLWSGRGREGIPHLADRIVQEGPDASAIAEIGKSNPEQLAALVDELAVHMLASEGKEQELHHLLDLKTLTDAGSDLVGQYNRSVRSELSHRRSAESIDPKMADALTAITKRVADHYVDALQDRAVDGVRTGAVEGSKILWSFGRDLAGRVKRAATGESRLASHVRSGVDRMKASIGSVVPEGVVANLEKAKAGAGSVIEALSDIADVESDREIAARFTASLPTVAQTLDTKADAVGLGMLSEVAALVTGSTGHEVMYVRETGELQINELSGVGLRLGIGGTKRAFTRNAYGDVAGAPEEQRRSGAELGVVCAHVGTYGGKTADDVRGWHSTFSLGFNASIPLMADQSLFDVKGKRVRTVKLAPAEIDRIESQLSEVGESAAKWHDKMRPAAS